MQYTITALNGDSVKIEAENWMLAMGKALLFFDVDIEAAERLVCLPAADGSVMIEETAAARSWMIRDHRPDVQVKVSSASVEELLDEPDEDITLAGAEDLPPPVALVMPTSSTLEQDEPVSLAERIFDLTMEIEGAEPAAQCQMALELVLEFVEAEATCIATGTLNDPGMVIVAATGSAADRIAGRLVPFGEGLLGMCFDMRGTLVVSEMDGDSRHLDQLNVEHSVVAVLAVPLIDDDGLSYGVVQLINPPERAFRPDDVAAVEQVSSVLARALATT